MNLSIYIIYDRVVPRGNKSKQQVVQNYKKEKKQSLKKKIMGPNQTHQSECDRINDRSQQISSNRTIRSLETFYTLLTQVVTTLGNNHLLENASLTSCNQSCLILMDEFQRHYHVGRRDGFLSTNLPSWTSFIRDILTPIVSNYGSLRAFYVQIFLEQGGDHFVTFISFQNFWVPFNSWQDTFTLSEWSSNLEYLINAARSASRISLFQDPIGYIGQILERMKNLPNPPNNWHKILKQIFRAFQNGKIKSYGYF